MHLAIENIDTITVSGDRFRYVIHIVSDIVLTESVIQLWTEKMRTRETWRWKSIERSKVNPYELIMVVEKGPNFKTVARDRVSSWLEIMMRLVAENT